MANVAHEKPETEDQPTVKKLRIDEDAASVESVSTTEDRAESMAALANDSTEEKDLEAVPSNGSSATVSTPKAAAAPTSGFGGFGGFSSFAAGGGFSGFAKPSESTTSTASSSTSSGFGGFAKTAESSSSSGFSGFAMSAEPSSGFGAFAKATDDASEGFGEAATADFDPNAEENTAEFVPVVSLTEAETANGEEEERIIVEKRAKLFKLVGTDYVEVGVGPFRVLKPKDAQDVDQVRASARMVMRRESYPRGPGTKLILNARLTACVSCAKKSEKSLMVVVAEAPSSEDDEQTAVTQTSTTEQDPNKIKPVTYLLRFASQEDVLLVQDRVVDLLPARAATS